MKRFVLLILFLCSTVLSARTWQEIRSSGTLYVLTTDAFRDTGGGLHRIVMPIDREQALLQRFAKENGLRIEYVPVSSFRDLITRLESGKGDLISANLAETEERKHILLLSLPFGRTREVLFTAENSPIRGRTMAILNNRNGVFLPGTTYTQNFRKIALLNPKIRFRELPDTISHDDLIAKIESGEFEYSALDECDLDAALAARTRIRKLFPIREDVPLVFGARQSDTELIGKLNAFILSLRPRRAEAVKKEVRRAPLNPGLADLDAIRKRGYIRMLTNNNAFCCYLHKGMLCGFEYDLAKRFADSLGVMLVTVIPGNFKDLSRYLAEGKGDFIAANLTMTQERIRTWNDLSFCAPYGSVTQVLVGRMKEKNLSLQELGGRTIHVPEGKSYYDTVKRLQAQGISVRIGHVPPEELPIQTLRKVESGVCDLTVVDRAFFDLAVSAGCRVKVLRNLTPEESYSWVVRKHNPQLLAAVQAFFRKENRSTFFNLTKKRYYSTQNAKILAPYVIKGKEVVISPYDALFRKYAERYRFSWTFLAAQSFQESRFQADRVNEIGATGLMQMMPATAREMKAGNLKNPENAIAAGAKYMAKLRDRITGAKTEADRLCFALAAYNAGYGHLSDARKLAGQLGLDPGRWTGHTEKAMSYLEIPRYASQAKFGFCRASETIPYVKNIMFQWYHYQELLRRAKLNQAVKK